LFSATILTIVDGVTGTFFSLGKNSMFSQILFSRRWVLQTEPSPVASVPSGEASKKENVITKSVEKVL